MTDKRGPLRDFLRERDIHCLGFKEDVVPTAESAWRYVARSSVTVLDKIPVDDIERLNAAFCRAALDMSFSGGAPLLLSVSGFGALWARVDISELDALIQKVCVYPDEPRFILFSELEGKLLAVDTEEWDFLLIAARWSGDGPFVPLAESGGGAA